MDNCKHEKIDAELIADPAKQKPAIIAVRCLHPDCRQLVGVFPYDSKIDDLIHSIDKRLEQIVVHVSRLSSR